MVVTSRHSDAIAQARFHDAILKKWISLTLIIIGYYQQDFEAQHLYYDNFTTQLSPLRHPINILEGKWTVTALLDQWLHDLKASQMLSLIFTS